MAGRRDTALAAGTAGVSEALTVEIAAEGQSIFLFITIIIITVTAMFGKRIEHFEGLPRIQMNSHISITIVMNTKSWERNG